MAMQDIVRDLRDAASFCGTRGWGGVERTIRIGAQALEFQSEENFKMHRELEPHFLKLNTIKEIYEARTDHVWPLRRPPYFYLLTNPHFRACGGYWLAYCDLVAIIERRSPIFSMEDYGETWALFTHEPTDEQTASFKWR